jgi:hypothetical protein
MRRREFTRCSAARQRRGRSRRARSRTAGKEVRPMVRCDQTNGIEAVTKDASCLSPLWRPAKLITVRFGSAPSSRGRIDDRGVRVGPWAVAIARPAIRGCGGDRRSGAVDRGRSPDIRRRSGCVGRGRSPDIRRPSSSASNSCSSYRSSCCRSAVFAPMYSPANSRNARCRQGSTDPRFGRVQREFGR